jgi:hypothetical protein
MEAWRNHDPNRIKHQSATLFDGFAPAIILMTYSSGDARGKEKEKAKFSVLEKFDTLGCCVKS